MTKTTKFTAWKKISRGLKSPFKIKNGKPKHRSQKDLILQKQPEEKMTPINWQHVLDGLRDKDKTLDLSAMKMASVGMDKEMGFGFITDSESAEDARVVLQGPNPFLDNQYGLMNPGLGQHVPYSQIYDVKNNNKQGNSYLFLRYQ